MRFMAITDQAPDFSSVRERLLSILSFYMPLWLSCAAAGNLYGFEWDIHTIAGRNDADGCCSLAYDSTDTPHISYALDGAAMYATRDGNSWSTTPVYSRAGEVIGTSIAIGPNNRPRIALYHKSSSGDSLLYAAFNGTNWTSEVVETGTDFAKWDPEKYRIDLVFNNAGRPGIVYNGNGQELHDAFNDGSGWSIQNLYQYAVGFGALDFDSADLPGVTFGGRLHFRKFNGSEWSDIDRFGDAYRSAQYTSLKFDSADVTHIAAFETYLDAIIYVLDDGAGWTVETVAAIKSGNASGVSIDLDDADIPHIAFYDHSYPSYAVKYATRRGGAWQTEAIQTISSSTSADGYSVLALNSQGKPGVVYYMGMGGGLRYAEMAPAARPGFSAAPLLGTPPHTVHFTNETTGTATGYEWHFGDGNTSTEEDPTHVYATSGVFTVSLTAFSASESNTHTKENYITVGNLTAAFQGAPTVGPPPLNVQFTNLSSGPVEGFLWNFGDGNTSTNPNPAHTYESEGVYSVSLSATNSIETDIATQADFITVAKVNAAFSGEPRAGYAPLRVQFTDRSTGPADQWQWDFGDGGSSSERDPFHTYEAIGNYTVTLTAGNDADSSSANQTAYIVVEELGLWTHDGFYTGDDIASLSLAMDQDDRPHIAVVNYTLALDSLTHAVLKDGRWTMETVDTDTDFLASPSVAIRPGNLPCIAYGGAYSLRYAALNGASWGRETIQAGTQGVLWSGINPSLALDRSGYPHISYSVMTGFPHPVTRIRHTWNTGSGWAVEDVVTAGVGTMASSALALTTNDHPRVLYVDQSVTNLMMAAFDGAAWSHELVLHGGTAQRIMGFDLVLDRHDRPHASCVVDRDGERSIQYGLHDGTNWVFQTVDSGGAIGGDIHLVLDSREQPRLVYLVGDAVTYAALEPRGWEIDVVGRAAEDATLALTSGDAPTIVAAREPATLEYTVLNPAAMLRAAFSATPRSGDHPLRVRFSNQSTGWFTHYAWDFGDGTGSTTEPNPYHTYTSNGIYDVSLSISNSFRAVSWTETGFIQVQDRLGEGWSVEVIEEDAGDDPPLAIDGNDRLHVAYQHYAYGTLKYAYSDGGGEWFVETVDAASKPGAIRMVLTSSGMPRILYSDSNASQVKLASYDGAAWDIRTVAVSNQVLRNGGSYSLTLDSLDRPCIGYAPHDAGFIRLEGDTWRQVSARALEFSESLRGLDLAIAGSGQPWLGFCTSGAYGRFFEFGTQVFDGTRWVWQFNRVVSPSAYGPSLRIGPSGSPQAVCSSEIGLHHVQAFQTGSTWTVRTLSHGPAGDCAQLRLTREGLPRVAYRDSQSRALWYATIDGGAWNTETVYRSGLVGTGLRPAFAFDSRDNPHLVFFDMSDQGLWRVMHAWKNVNHPLTAAFEADRRRASPGTPIQFTDGSLGQPLSYAWDFGDRAVSTLKDPVHTYLGNGKYTVSLVVSNLTELSSTTRVDYIQVADLSAEFSADRPKGPPPHTVQFTNLTAGTVLAQAWDFGDGSPVAHEANPAHTYAEIGAYDVTLTVSNAQAVASETKEGFVTVTDLGVLFFADPREGAADLSVTFTDATFGDVTNRWWDFGDGSAGSAEANPTHVYTNVGAYDVSLQVWGPKGTDRHTATNFITVHDLHVDFSASPTAGPCGMRVQFNNESGGAWDSLEWDFGEAIKATSTAENPSHVYAFEGQYDVTLTLINETTEVSLTKSNLITITDLAVTDTWPRMGEYAVAVDTNITIAFSMPVSNVTAQTVVVEPYTNTVPLGGIIHPRSDTQWQFLPDVPFPEATAIRVTVKGGQDGIRSVPSGAIMEFDHNFYFETQPRVKLKLIQALENMPLHFISNKPTMANVEVEGLTDSNVAATVSLLVDGAQVDSKTAVIRPRYTELEQKEGKNGVNFFLSTPGPLDVPGTHKVTAMVTPVEYPQRIFSNQTSCVVTEPSGHLAVEFLPIGIASWHAGIHDSQKEIYMVAAQANKDFLRAAWPVNHDSLNVRITEQVPPEFLEANSLDYLMLQLHSRARADNGIDRCVGMVPKGSLFSTLRQKDLGAGASYGEGRFGVLAEAAEGIELRPAVAAHELMHTYGRYFGELEDYKVHQKRGSFADAGWNVSQGDAGCIRNMHPIQDETNEEFYDPARNALTLKSVFYSYMGDAVPSKHWSKIVDYEFLYGRLVLGNTGSKALRSVRFDEPTDLILLSGFIQTNETVLLEPIVRGDSLDPEEAEPPEATHFVEFLQSGTLLKRFGFDVLPLSYDNSNAAAFAFTVEQPLRADTMRFVTSNEVVLADWSLNGDMPVVSLRYPVGNETLTGLVEVAWVASDTDSDDLNYTLYYSEDGKLSWRLLALNITQTNFLWDTSSYGYTDNGWIKVQVSDGLLTDSDTHAAAFALPMKAPRVSILSPADGAIFSDEDEIALCGFATDPQGTPLAQSQIVWSSDADGVLGVGAAITPRRLSYGPHQLSLTVVNAAGMTGTAAVAIEVRPEVFRITSLNGSPGLGVSWFARYGKRYRLMVSSNLLDNSWRDCDYMLDEGGMLLWEVDGAERDMTAREAGPGDAGRRFYRIRVDE